MTTAHDVAVWMAKRLDESGILAQEEVVWDIREQFGDAFVYENDNGQLAIAKNVLTAFNKLTKETVVWVKPDRSWRKRLESDEPGREQMW